MDTIEGLKAQLATKREALADWELANRKELRAGDPATLEFRTQCQIDIGVLIKRIAFGNPVFEKEDRVRLVVVLQLKTVDNLSDYSETRYLRKHTLGTVIEAIWETDHYLFSVHFDTDTFWTVHPKHLMFVPK